MTPSEFARKLGRIEHFDRYEAAERSWRSITWKARARKRLIREAGAEVVPGGWRLATGRHVCRKVRYKSEAHALHALRCCTIAPTPKRNESRAYHCPRCNGWHLTSD